MEERIISDFNEVLDQSTGGETPPGKDGLLAPLITQLTAAALEAEVESHIAHDALSGKSNRRPGFTSKTIKGPSDGS
ncbi:IS256 family transposase, partial [Aliarcobacter butzleri]